MNNLNGVPFFKSPEVNDFFIDGFEVDEQGNFYFFGGAKQNCLAVFAGNKQLFRTTYKEVSSSELYIFKKSLYMFDQRSNDIIIIDKSNGTITKKIHQITSGNPSSYGFLDNSIIIQTLGDQKSIYTQYDLSGKFIKRVANAVNIPESVMSDKDVVDNCEFLGRWNNNYVVWNYKETIFLINADGTVLAKKAFPEKFFGQGYAENISENRKLRNGSFYVLGRKGKYAMITEVPLSAIFAKSR